MHERQQEFTARLTSVLDYLKKPPITPVPPLLTAKHRELQATVERLRAHAHVQVTTARGANVDARRNVLRKTRMIPLRQLARGQLKFAPGVEPALKTPHARASASTIAAAALRMANALMPHARLLKSAGVGKDFLREMRHEARGLALACKQTAAARARLREATAGIKTEIQKGLGILATIDGMIMLHAPSEMDRWMVFRRKHKKVGRPRTIRRRKPRSEIPPS